MYIYNIQKNFVNIKRIKFCFTDFLHFFIYFAMFILNDTAFHLWLDTIHTAKAPITPPKNIPEIIPNQNIKSILFMKNICRLIMPEKTAFYPC